MNEWSNSGALIKKPDALPITQQINGLYTDFYLVKPIK